MGSDARLTREATAAEISEAGLDQQRGWWADADSVRPTNTHRMGSKLWLLSRAKLNLATRRRAATYAREALQWLIDRGIASTVGGHGHVATSGLACPRSLDREAERTTAAIH